MREGWTYKKLGEITNVINGLWIGKKPPFKTVAVIRNTNFTKDCKLSTTNIAYIDVEEKQFEKKRLLQGDIIIEKSGGSEKQPVGRPILFNLIGGEFSFSNFTSVIRIDNPNMIVSPFLHLALYGAYLRGETSKMQAKTTGIHNLDFKAYNRILIPIPTLQEQQQIVSELDLLSSVIEKQKAQIEELDKLAQSIFYDMFGDPVENEKGWEVKKMEEICTYIVDCPHSTPRKAESITKYPCIRTSELKNGSISWDTMQYLEENEYNIRIARLKPEAGDIVFGREGTLGEAVILPSGYHFSLGQRTMLLRVDTNVILNSFLHRTILSEWIKRQIDYVNVSSTVAHVNIKDFKHFIVPIPPLSLQQEFADKIQAIESMKAKVRQSLKESEMLFNSRMDYYFN